ncbi:thiol:disulfide interchange protein DsbA [Bathymodiolus platifrons methanotrophic gill symbiont]|uniref:thiol:disulfide interchange protein DsbA/DsbL n=1 Tax=Bathymodiolus platifrons methanotrophic gill symbiont TaxID=113268 RepID=UPI000B413F81|nr:thiol:disulfide interchange protein DsbA/DsbL [Bathymodiolus platifrons methanotrophic gill symbiont]MCK5870585.1 thiol:disulfide interchange protein DsbA/DsbL [Methyloprofundus sp.]TXK94799.1 disulfide bond formation protein DsbA [Methylococcaceae bacterium CS5]TXK96021.1 disulfide bond formation protein DsbA [Methylococcaceae bacterium CS4]TXL05442.1 disulfide bond formation protein DsbA [Methylococcaceae bacterium CS1]TXL05817.1 disulfide bond formation protein DsbA [Methylococcaceae bac
MLKNIIKTALLSLFVFASVSFAAGKGYKDLSATQPTQDPAKVEVIEFFWYGCPHCYQFEPALDEWKANLPENVTFIRQPAVFSAVWAKHAKAYFTAEVLGVVDKVHADFFLDIQVKKQKLTSEEDLAVFFVAHGVDKAAFHDAYNSFIVDTKMRQAKTMGPRYGITGVPAIVVNGKYLVNGKTAGSHGGMIKVMNELIAQESK